MYIKKVTYTDYDGVERTETCMFNLTKAELSQMQMEQAGGLDARLTRMLEMQDAPSIMKTIKELLHRSYGEKSPDGRRFIKVDPATGIHLADEFEQTEAYSQIYMELCTNAEMTADFIANVVPKDVAEAAKLYAKEHADDLPNVASMPAIAREKGLQFMEDPD